MHLLQRCVLAASLLALAACSKDKDIDVPAQLTDIKHPTVKLERIWSARVSDKDGARLRLGLELAMDGSRVFAANHRGEVVAYEISNGHRVWSHKTRAPLSAGPSAAGGLVALGTSAGEVIVLRASDGGVRWQVRLNGEILSAPTISERTIAVRTVDGKIHGLSPEDGHETWTQEQQVPRLSLRGTSRPVINGDLAVCGFDNGKIMAVNMNDGSVQWEATLAPPHGKTELERLVDVDSDVHVAGQDVYAVGFQGRVAMLSLDTGQIWWSHDASSYRSMGIDEDDLYVATADGEIVALRRRTGAELWRQKALLHRGLSSVAITEHSLISGDQQGYLHWLDKATGELQARVRIGKARISRSPEVSGNIVVAATDAGQIQAFRMTPVAAPKRAEPEAPKKAPPAAPATKAPDTDAGPTRAPPEPQAQPQPQQ